ncbi:MAG: hypothetical protein LAN70_08290 [Acidobacteriia bacterium]|nr:hypothetical protein [Terriglobia bacterium]
MLHSLRLRTRLVWVLLQAVSTVALAQIIEKSKYQVIEVKQFEFGQGTNMPKSFQRALMQETALALLQIGKFKEVLREGEKPADPGLPLLQLTTKVTEFQGGSDWGFFRAKTRIAAHIKFIDAATGRVLVEDDLKAEVELAGLRARESIDVTRSIAKEIAKVTKQRFF